MHQSTDVHKNPHTSQTTVDSAHIPPSDPVGDKETEQLRESIKSALKKDGGFYVSTLILLGYLFTTIQQMVRYSYYGVDLTYLLSIKIEDILLGVLYVIVIILIPLLAYEAITYSTNRSLMYAKRCFFLICCGLFSYALTQRIPLDFILLFTGLVLITHIIAFKCSRLISRIKEWNETTPLLRKLTFLIISLSLAVSFMQFGIETYNKRFTYTEYEGKEYAVLTTFQDNFITLESEISGSSIIIFRGNVRLIPINETTLLSNHFTEKLLQ